MNHLKQKPSKNRAFTLIELLVVISIIAIVATMIVGFAKFSGQKKIRTRVQAEMAALQLAIDRYHTKLGFYPPDGKDADKPPLLYELTGTKFIQNADSYETLKGNQRLKPEEIEDVFGRRGFANSSPEDAQNFYPDLKAAQFRGIADYKTRTVDALVVPAEGPNDLPAVDGGKPVNTWRYATGSRSTVQDPVMATNNPNGYDLWAEVKIGNKVEIIGNWKTK